MTRLINLNEAPHSTRLAALTPTPAAGFEEPFQMLQACHERIGRTLDLLARLRAHLAQHGADEQARQAARDILRYFDTAAPQHHLDEELHVFPALLAGDDEATRALVARLQQDHLQMDSNWRQARRVLAAIEGGEPGAPGGLAPSEENALAAFAGLYADHIAAEEQRAYPAALARLDPRTLAAMGQDMKRRRGVV